MKEIKFESNFGRFAYEITASIGEEVNEPSTNLCIRGLADTGFRGVSSDVEKALVAGKFMTEKQKRSEVVYSVEAAVLIAEKAQAKLDEVAKKGGLPAMFFRVTGEHKFGEGGEISRKTATALWSMVQSQPEEVFSMACKMYGIPEEYTDETAVEAIHKVLQSTKQKKA